MKPADNQDDTLLENGSDLRVQLRSGLGDEGYLALIENHGGARLYIPNKTGPRSTLIDTLSIEHFKRLVAAFGGLYIRVPLDREFIIQQYYAKGYSRKKIIRTLRITESGLERILQRLRREGSLPAPPSFD